MVDISLVIPTYGRSVELRELLVSLSCQDYELSRIEIIVVDQNDVIDLSPIIRDFAHVLRIVHLKSEEKGIAHSKNLGLRSASADIISFPDDDCTYYPDTVSSAIRVFKEHPEYDIVYGRIYDRVHNKNIMRNWSGVAKKLNMFNFHLEYSAITCFTRLKELGFDEHFGVGSAYGVGEELDYIMQALKQSANVYFTPEISIWHPELNVGVMPDAKVRYYAKGYGATFRKNVNFPFLCIFFMSLVYMLMGMVLETAKGNGEMAGKRWLGFKARMGGFLSFRNG